MKYLAFYTLLVVFFLLGYWVALLMRPTIPLCPCGLDLHKAYQSGGLMEVK